MINIILLKRQRIISILILISLFIISFHTSCVILDRVVSASTKRLWTDETFGLSVSVKKFDYGYMIIHGVDGQASPSPLDYLCQKILADIRYQVNFFGFRPEIYYRLFPISMMCLALIIVSCIYSLDILRGQYAIFIKIIQLIILCAVPFVYFYEPLVSYYALELRPYSLWNSIFLIICALGLRNKPWGRGMIVCLCMLGFTATASIYQISLCVMAYFIVHFRRHSLKENVLTCFRIFSLPMIISLYYCLKVEEWNWPVPDDAWVIAWNEYLGFWVRHALAIPMMLLIWGLNVRQNRGKFISPVPLMFATLFVLGPFLFQITRWKGFFYQPRQYLYYDLYLTIFFCGIIQQLPAFLQNVRSKLMGNLFLVFIVLFMFVLILDSHRMESFYDSFQNAVHFDEKWYSLKLFDIDLRWGI